MSKMRKHILIYFQVLAGLCFFLVTAGYTETVTLELKKLDDLKNRSDVQNASDTLFRRTSSQGFSYQQNEKKDFSALIKKEKKEYQCKYPFKGALHLGNDDYAFVLDSSDIKAKGYDLLLFDKNKNGDLTDDEVIRAKSLTGGMPNGQVSADREFPKIELPIQAGEQKFEYAFFFQVYSQFVENSGQESIPFYASARINAAAYREGEIQVNGKKTPDHPVRL